MLRGYKDSDREDVERLVLEVVGSDDARSTVERVDGRGRLTGVFLDVDEEGVRGVAIVEVVTWSAEAELHLIAVDASARRHGVGTALLTAAEAIAKRLGAEALLVTVPSRLRAGPWFAARRYELVSDLSEVAAERVGMSPGATYAKRLTPTESGEIEAFRSVPTLGDRMWADTAERRASVSGSVRTCRRGSWARSSV